MNARKQSSDLGCDRDKRTRCVIFRVPSRRCDVGHFGCERGGNAEYVDSAGYANNTGYVDNEKYPDNVAM